jgi:hypothetical protein
MRAVDYSACVRARDSNYGFGYNGKNMMVSFLMRYVTNILIYMLLDFDWVLISPPDIKDKWVSIYIKEKWGKSVNDDPNHSIKQFPICLAWVLTVWKSQGMVIKGLVKEVKI